MKESVKIDRAVVGKARKYVKKSKQTIGGFFEFSAGLVLAGEIEVAEWQRKAAKWDALEAKIAKFYPEEMDGEQEEPGDLTDIGEVAAMAFGYL